MRLYGRDEMTSDPRSQRRLSELEPMQKEETRHQPKVSVLMTAYNREKYIAEAIESVLNQTFADFELIIVDDCSRDRTVSIAQSYTTDPRVRVIVNDHNFKDYPNRNHAATFARGAFLKYHDSDDIMYPYCLEVMVEALESEPRAAFALSGYKYWPGGPCPMLSTPQLSYRREFLGWGGMIFGVSPSHGMYRADAFRELGCFPESGVYSDALFWLRACAKVNVLLVPADLYWWRSHPGQEYASATSFGRADVYSSIWKMLTSLECPLTGSELVQARQNWTFQLFKEVLQAVLHGRLQLAAYTFTASGITLPQWFRYLRRGRRSANAGTPLNENGGYLIPRSLLPKA